MGGGIALTADEEVSSIAGQAVVGGIHCFALRVGDYTFGGCRVDIISLVALSTDAICELTTVCISDSTCGLGCACSKG